MKISLLSNGFGQLACLFLPHKHLLLGPFCSRPPVEDLRFLWGRRRK